MIPVPFPQANGVLAATQDEYEPLPVYQFGDAQGRVAFCCRLSDAEIAQIVRTRSLWVQQLTFGKPFQPMALTTHQPHDLPEFP